MQSTNLFYHLKLIVVHTSSQASKHVLNIYGALISFISLFNLSVLIEIYQEECVVTTE